MLRIQVAAIAAVFVVAGAAAFAGSGTAEDDLAVVKRATAASQDPRPVEPPPTVSVRRAGREPAWLKVRIVEKASKKARITVNLPLALVHAFGDDWPVSWHCRKDGKAQDRCSIRVSEVLRALESGQDLVQIDDDDATVRIWVE